MEVILKYKNYADMKFEMKSWLPYYAICFKISIDVIKAQQIETSEEILHNK